MQIARHGNIFKSVKISVICAFLFPLIQACGIFHPNRMIDTDKDYQFQSFLDSMPKDFVLQQGDVIDLYVFPKKGYVLFESQIAGQPNGGGQQVVINSLPYLLDESGKANLPLVGFVKLGGLTENQAEVMLTELYTAHYIEPFVNINITNKFVTVFRGSADAKQIIITRPDITVLDIIGQAGGIPETGKAENIKVIRKQNGIVQVEELDLTEIEGISQSQYYVRPNDIIYIEPNINSLFFKEAAPVITAISGVVVIYVFLYNLGK